MTRIITFLGKAPIEQTTLAIATAKWFARDSQRVLLVTHNPSPSAEVLLETSLKPIPQKIAPNLDVVQLQTTFLLEQVWDEVKKWLGLYIPDSVKVDVYSGEVVILPGFDSLLGFNALRQYYESDNYDVIIYDGRGDLESLRMLGLPNSTDWYLRRFRQVFESLDLSKIADSIGGPIASAFVTANMDSRKVQEAIGQIQSWISKGLAVVGDAKRLTAYLITTDEPGAERTASWLWGSAQQIGLTVSGVLSYQSQVLEDDKVELYDAFQPLPVSLIPKLQKLDWEPLLQALPDFNNIPHVPRPLTFDLQQRQAKVFLPGFTKQQVKLTILGTELTVEAGEQRRNIFLPKELRGQPVIGGKFEEPYLIIYF
ncbi:anion-transporting ATPase [Calothrix sp. NIES-4071]|nr:anion-transporting ATPase [Calothrix sp. NIES-4071]BAZ57830.1 anion-transporting ATPase [Calothrix sp. NIES-4105]